MCPSSCRSKGGPFDRNISRLRCSKRCDSIRTCTNIRSRTQRSFIQSPLKPKSLPTIHVSDCPLSILTESSHPISVSFAVECRSAALGCMHLRIHTKPWKLLASASSVTALPLIAPYPTPPDSEPLNCITLHCVAQQGHIHRSCLYFWGKMRTSGGENGAAEGVYAVCWGWV